LAADASSALTRAGAKRREAASKVEGKQCKRNIQYPPEKKNDVKSK
jgi:hypothetical protein